MQVKTKNPDYLYIGQEVFIPARVVVPDCKPGTGLRCKVEVAHGDAGVVVNENYKFRRLVSRWDMWVEIDQNSENPV